MVSGAADVIFIEKGSEKVRYLKMGRPGRGDYTPKKGFGVGLGGFGVGIGRGRGGVRVGRGGVRGGRGNNQFFVFF